MVYYIYTYPYKNYLLVHGETAHFSRVFVKIEFPIAEFYCTLDVATAETHLNHITEIKYIKIAHLR